VNVTKSISSPSGASPSGPYTVTLTYTNNGGAAATAVKLIDIIPVGMTYVGGSARWSVTGPLTVLTDISTDGAQGALPTITYDMTGTTVTAVISSVPTTVSGTLTFQVNINANLAPQVLNNTATVGYHDGTSLVGPFNTNTATFTVRQTAALTISAGTTAASATQGATVSFTSAVTNSGNGSDAFDITLSGSTFPPGTTFAILKSDGVTPLMDSNTNGIPDTGPLASAATVNVVIQAVLPPAISGGGTYIVKVTATSTIAGAINAGASALATDTLTTIAVSTVDLTNNSTGSGAPGYGTGPGASARITNTVLPGATTTFALYAANTNGPADSYDLLASSNETFPGTLPSGWSVQFRSSTGTDCTTLGASISGTPVVNSGSSTLVCAVVTVPANYAAGTYPVYFQALSAATAAKDSIRDAITVSIVHAVTLTPNQSGQVYPGGSVVYSHYSHLSPYAYKYRQYNDHLRRDGQPGRGHWFFAASSSGVLGHK
jgi:trimeric autotransporter adhesin